VPEGLPQIVDAHVHLFPDKLFNAVYSWLDEHAWPIRYKRSSPEHIEFLTSRGISRIVGLHYTHGPGMAAKLNSYMAGLCKEYPQLIGTATVYPGEENAAGILEDGFRQGLSGVKLHAHVQFFEMDSPAMREVYEVCAKHDKPLVMHVGREPKSPVFPYPRDPYDICSASKLEWVIREYSDLRVCVPHLGADEFEEYANLIEKYDNLWLDVAMAIADYLPIEDPPYVKDMRADRIMYGTDFPNIPYAWDRELKRLCEMGLSEEALARILGKNALELFLKESD
jgi:predicted TIM-barrel fold metal-dependent hydrolase